MPSGVGYGPDYRAFKQWLKSADVECRWCGRARAVTPDHEPPIDLFETEAAWRDAGGELVPACDRCNKSRGARYVNAKRRRRRSGKVFQSAERYPPSTW